MTYAHLALASPASQPLDHTSFAVNACVDAALRGELNSFLDQKLFAYLTKHVNGAPLGAAQHAHGEVFGYRLAGTAQLLTSRIGIDAIWRSHTGSTARSYGTSATFAAETWGERIEEAMFGWISSWITSVAGRLRHADRADVRERVLDALHQADTCESEWERSRRSMTFGQLRDAVRSRPN